MKYWIIAITIGLTLACHAVSALAVTAWREDPGMLVEADEAIIPASLIGGTPDNLKRNNTMETADPLRIGDKPLDRVIYAGEENWYLLKTADGPGDIRIGATGPIRYMEASFDPNEGLQRGVRGAFDGPKEGAALLEASITSITYFAAIRRHKTTYLKISTRSTTPVSYRISFVRELPKNRVDNAYGPAVAASDYIMAVAYSDVRDLYQTTRIRHTTEQALALRQKLFGTKDELPQHSFGQFRRDPSLDSDAEANLPVQHIILADYEIFPGDGRNWAFIVKCEKRDGLWLVTDAYRDPGLSDEEISEIIRRNLDRMMNIKVSPVTDKVCQAFDESLLIVPKEAEIAAQKGLPRFLKVILDNQEFQDFNFHDEDEVEKATVGKPIRFFIVSKSAILQGDPKKTLIDCLYPMPEWSFPVISGGEVHGWLEVVFAENEWKAVGFGGGGTPVDPYSSVFTKWPLSQGYKHIFVRNIETHSEFVVLLQGGETKVVPLPAAMLLLGLKEDRVLEQPEAMKLLRDRLNEINRQTKKTLR